MSATYKKASKPMERRKTRTHAMWRNPSFGMRVAFQVVFLALVLGTWEFLVETGVIAPYLIGQPTLIAQQAWAWTSTGFILPHAATTLLETVFAFILGVTTGVIAGMWLGLSPLAAILLDPYIKALNAMPRVILAPLFIVWFGLGIGSKVALGTTLVFCIVFFNVFQGVREVSPVVLQNARMLGASKSQLLRTVYTPSAMSWVFSSLHTSVGMAFVGAVVGEYLGSARGLGYIILQAESVFDTNAVFAGIVILTVLALILDHGVTLLERHFLSWRPSHNV